MKQLIPLIALLALLGCDSQSSGLDAGSAVIIVDGRQSEASASISQQEFDGIVYRVISLDIETGDRIELWGQTFETGRFVRQHEANTSFPFSFSYVKGGDEPSAFIGGEGSLEIVVAGSTHITGDFEFETRNVFSSCTACDAAKGPSVHGSFNAVQK